MNTKFYSCLLALGTFASAILLGITPASAGGSSGNGSENGFNNPVVIPIKGGSGNGSENGFNNPNIQPVVVAVTTQSLTVVNSILSDIIIANPQALSSVTSPAALVPSGASQSVSDSAAVLASKVAGLKVGEVSGFQLNEVFSAHNDYVTKLVESVGGEKAISFASSAGGVKDKDGTPAPSLRSQLLKLREGANSK